MLGIQEVWILPAKLCPERGSAGGRSRSPSLTMMLPADVRDLVELVELVESWCLCGRPLGVEATAVKKRESLHEAPAQVANPEASNSQRLT